MPAHHEHLCKIIWPLECRTLVLANVLSSSTGGDYTIPLHVHSHLRPTVRALSPKRCTTMPSPMMTPSHHEHLCKIIWPLECRTLVLANVLSSSTGGDYTIPLHVHSHLRPTVRALSPKRCTTMPSHANHAITYDTK